MSSLLRVFLEILAFAICLLIAGCKGDIGGPSEPGPPWVKFSTANSPLPDNAINQIYVDRELRVWFATKQGAAYFQQKSWGIIRDSLKYTIYDHSTPIAAYNVTSIIQGKDRSIWFGLGGGGAARYNAYSQNGNTWTRYRSPTLTSDNIESLAADVSDASVMGEIWIVSYGGMNRFIENSTNGGTWIDYQVPPSPTVAAVSPIDYSIWIGSASNGLEQISYSPNFSLTNIPLPGGYVGKITGIAFDANNNVWIAKDVGVSVINLQSGLWTHYTSSNTNGNLPSGEIHAVASDLVSNRWFGTDSGLVHLVDTTWTRYTTANSPLPDNTVTSIHYDLRGNLWIGTRNGVAAYKPGGTTF